MTAVLKVNCQLRIWKDTHGQDLMEYALLAGFLAAACAATLPNIATNVSTVFLKVVAMLGTNGFTAPGG